MKAGFSGQPLFDGRHIAASFGPRTSMAKTAIAALAQALMSFKDRESLLEKWRTAHPVSEKARSLLSSGQLRFTHDAASLCDLVGAEDLLLATHTYFALVVKMVTAFVVTSQLFSDERQADVALLISRKWLKRLESGRLFREVGILNFPGDSLFRWHVEVRDKGLDETIEVVFRHLSRFRFPNATEGDGGFHELFGSLYASLIPRKLRHSVGEFYTPEWLVDFVLDNVEYRGESSVRLVDPSCGPGAFLVRALSRALELANGSRSGHSERTLASLEDGLPIVAGMDVNPLAVLAAKANYIISLRRLLPFEPSFSIPVSMLDVIAEEDISLVGNKSRRRRARNSLEQGAHFDVVVGNPPWVLWDNLSAECRDKTKPLWRRYGLFSLPGSMGRMGGAKKDLSMLFVYRCMDRLLKDGGELAFVMAQSAFKTRGAGEGFRRFSFPSDGSTAFVNVKTVHDITRLRPFVGALNRTAVLVCERSSCPTSYPVPYWMWTPRRRGAMPASHVESAEKARFAASPIDEQNSASAWLTIPEELMRAIRQIVGPASYQAHEGVNSAGLLGCFTVRPIETYPDGSVLIENVSDAGKIRVEKVRAIVEQGLLFRQLLGRDLKKWSAVSSAHILLTQDPITRAGIDEATMSSNYPKTLEYFRKFERPLRQRAAFRKYYDADCREFWSMFNVGPYTLARWRVGWRTMGSDIGAAVLPFEGDRPVLPQNSHAFVACQSEAEAHFICGLMNSSLVGFLVRSYSVAGGRSFATPQIMEYVKVPRHDGADVLHNQIADLSLHCHLVKEKGQVEELTNAEAELDHLAASCLGFPPDLLPSLSRASRWV